MKKFVNLKIIFTKTIEKNFGICYNFIMESMGKMKKIFKKERYDA